MGKNGVDLQTHYKKSRETEKIEQKYITSTAACRDIFYVFVVWQLN